MAEPGNVLIMNAEDDLERVIRPRLGALGANLSRCWALEEVEGAEGKRPPMLPDDLPLIEELIRKHGIGLVIIDPFMAYLGPDVDPHVDADIRRVMFAIRKVAERTQAAFLIIRHLNKAAGLSDPMYRGGGSIGIIGASRSALLVAPDPDDTTKTRRILARVKGNLCAAPASLVYTIERGERGPIVQWHGEANVGAGDLLKKSRASEKDSKEQHQVHAAGTKLLNALDKIDPERKGATKNQLRELARVSGRDMTCAVHELIEAGVLEEVEMSYASGKGRTVQTVGIRRPANPSGQ